MTPSTRFLPWRLVAVGAALLSLVAAPWGEVAAQSEPEAPSPALPGGGTFEPVLFVLGSTSNNEFRSASDPVGDSSLYAEVDLPFAFRGPRWEGGFSLRPSFRKYRDNPDLDDYQGSGDAWLSGALSRRTRLTVRASASFSPELSGLDEPDLITPRSDRLRTRARAELRHRLSPLDSLTLGAEHELIDYRDDDFRGVQRIGASAGLSKGLGPRLAATVGVRGDHLSYEVGGSADGLSLLGGLGYDLGPRTEVDVSAGIGWITGTRGGGEEPADVARRSLTFEGGLRHVGDGWTSNLRAERRLGTGVALGEPTILTQASGGLQLGGLRWRLGVGGGFARNELLDDGTGILLGQEGLLLAGDRVDTWSACADAGYRLTRWLSIVGSGRFARQLTGGVDEPLDIDVYRLSVGFGLHPVAPPLRPRSGGGAAGIERYRRFATLGSC